MQATHLKLLPFGSKGRGFLSKHSYVDCNYNNFSPVLKTETHN